MNELPNYCSGCGAPFTACVQTDPQCVTRMLTLNEARVEELEKDLAQARAGCYACEPVAIENERLLAEIKAKTIEIEDMKSTCAFLHETEADNERLTAAKDKWVTKAAIKTADLIKADERNLRLQARVEALEGDLNIMRLQRDATHVSRCPKCASTEPGESDE